SFYKEPPGAGNKLLSLEQVVATPHIGAETVLSILESVGLELGEDFGLGMNPEFLREGMALDDFMNPDRIIIGGVDERSRKILSEIYENFDSPIMITEIKTAEMIKYVSNALLATKISFANEMARLCEKVGADIYQVMDGVGLDHRIERKFLNAGVGFGGSCFPKDVRALIYFSRNKGINPRILESVIKVNEHQPMHAVNMMEDMLGRLSGKRIALLGLAFKGNTDDVRESRAIPMTKELLKRGARIVGYDPMAAENFSQAVSNVEYAETIEEALTGSDGCIIQTDWDEFRDLKEADFSVMRIPVVLDGRRVLDPEEFNRIRYRTIGK
ncbi:MAG: nucleotide sugar dehydrogenase, partial [Thermoplasmata archaeon]